MLGPTPVASGRGDLLAARVHQSRAGHRLISEAVPGSKGRVLGRGKQCDGAVIRVFGFSHDRMCLSSCRVQGFDGVAVREARPEDFESIVSVIDAWWGRSVFLNSVGCFLIIFRTRPRVVSI